MPGRQAHGRPLLANPNKKRKSSGGGKSKAKANGAAGAGGAPLSGRNTGGAPRTRQGGRVDVMALAEKQISAGRTKGVRTRDLEVERDQKRRRGDDDEDDEDEDEDDDEGAAPKRRRPNNEDDSEDEIHSDSDGNEWHEGVGDDEDSDIDSDDAFGASDDENFDAFTFRGSSSNKSNKSKKKAAKGDEFDGFDDPSDLSDMDVGDDGAELGDEAIDLAAALDIVSSDEDEAPKPKKKSKKSKHNDDDSDDDMSGSATSPYSGSEDEDDSGLSSDSGSGSGTEESESEEESDDEESDDEPAGADALKNIASAYAGAGSDDESGSDSEMESSANPYAFSASLGSLGSLGALARKDKSLKKAIKASGVAASEKTLAVPLLPMQQAEKLRSAAAEKAHETLDRWTETVKHNRRAEHLTFDVAGSLAASGLDTTSLAPITSTATAQTDLERTILSIMEESGLGAKAQEEERHQERLRKQEAAAEAQKQLSPDELKALIGQKRRERELKSQEVARAKRIKKIKSKAYRRVHRRERQRAEEMAADSDEDADGAAHDSDAEREAHHRQRAMERMGARHRDSKWAKKGKATNRAAWDDEYRQGLVDMARQDDELRRRIDGAGVGGAAGPKDGSDDESDDSFGDESDDDAFRERAKSKLEALAGAAEEPTGLMGIAFMRKAEDARKKENDEAIAEIMADLDRGSDDDSDAMDVDRNDDEPAVTGRRTFGPAAGQAQAPATKDWPKDKPKKDTNGDKKEAAPASAPASAPAAAMAYAQDTSRTTVSHKVSQAGDAGSWTTVPSKTASKKKAPQSSRLSTVTDTTGLTADGQLSLENVIGDIVETNAKGTAAQAAAQAGGDSDTSSSGSDSEDDAAPRAGGKPASRMDRHGNVVRFAGENEKLLLKALGEDHAAAEFADEKARQAAEEAAAWQDEQSLGKKPKKTFMDGWGSWAGEGMSKRAVKKQEANRAHLEAAEKKKDPKTPGRRDTKLERVIISEKRQRKTEKYLASAMPHEFESRAQYERSLRLPVGPEWSTTFAFQDATKPRILKKQGVVLPMAKPQL